MRFYNLRLSVIRITRFDDAEVIIKRALEA
jgi:hypothetical protein